VGAIDQHRRRRAPSGEMKRDLVFVERRHGNLLFFHFDNLHPCRNVSDSFLVPIWRLASRALSRPSGSSEPFFPATITLRHQTLQVHHILTSLAIFIVGVDQSIPSVSTANPY
jgi:hypothetical protein